MAKKQRVPATPSRSNVALLIESSSAFGRELQRGILTFAREEDSWSIQLPDNEPGYHQLSSLSSSVPDAVIARIVDSRMASRLRKMEVPVVDVAGGRDLNNGSWVATNQMRLVELGIEHFKRRGFRHVAFCGDNRFLWSVERQKLFMLYAASQNLEAYAYQAPESKGDSQPTWNRLSRSMLDWLQSLPKPVAVLASHDLRGQQLLDICHSASIPVPEQVAILGIDNDEIICNMCKPRLSSIIPNAFRAGYVAAQVLSDMLKGKLRKPLGIEIDAERVERRASTDIFVFDNAIVREAMQIIRNHACDGLKVVDVVRRMKVSRRTLDSHFIDVLGRTPHDELLRLRMERVKELLLETSLSIAAIARRTGIEREEYLNVAFKRIMGVTPGTYRRNRGGIPNQSER